MGAVWLRARAQLRGQVRASVLLALLVGLAGGMALAALTGARRSDTALPRFLATSDTVDTQVLFAGPDDGRAASVSLAELGALAALPQVRAAHRLLFLLTAESDPASQADPNRQVTLVGLDRPGHESLGRPILVGGPAPPAAPPPLAAVQ